MRLFNNGKTWMGMLEVSFKDFYRAIQQQNVNTLLVSRGFNPYNGYYAIKNYLKLTITCCER